MGIALAHLGRQMAHELVANAFAHVGDGQPRREGMAAAVGADGVAGPYDPSLPGRPHPLRDPSAPAGGLPPPFDLTSCLPFLVGVRDAPVGPEHPPFPM